MSAPQSLGASLGYKLGSRGTKGREIGEDMVLVRQPWSAVSSGDILEFGIEEYFNDNRCVVHESSHGMSWDLWHDQRNYAEWARWPVSLRDVPVSASLVLLCPGFYVGLGGRIHVLSYTEFKASLCYMRAC